MVCPPGDKLRGSAPLRHHRAPDGCGMRHPHDTRGGAYRTVTKYHAVSCRGTSVSVAAVRAVLVQRTADAGTCAARACGGAVGRSILGAGGGSRARVTLPGAQGPPAA